MLNELLGKAIDLGADRIEIEYKDRSEFVTAYRGPVGIGIGMLNAEQRDKVFAEIEKMKKQRGKITLRNNAYKLKYSEYESFGELVYVIALKP
jgi:hypothetical protein